jgi:hypothetical protein
MKSLTFIIAVVFALGVAGTSVAAAEPVVLQIDKGLVYVDLGSKDGVGAGTELELVREVVATDPVSRAVLRDKFALGQLTVVKAGEHVCQATPSEDLAGRVKIGDEIRLASEKRRFVDPWADRVADSKQVRDVAAPIATGPGADRATAARAVEEALAARTVWEKTLGKSPVDRAALWRAFLSERPQTPYGAVIRTEIASLDAQGQTLDRAAAAAQAPEPVLDRRRALADALAVLRNDPTQGPLWVGAPSRVAHGQPVQMTFAVREQIAGAMWLYVRGPDGAFRRVELNRDGDSYLRATIPAELVRGDRVEWFVEIGEGAGGMGSRDEPRVIAVDRDIEDPPPAANRTTIATSVDYVDFDGFGSKWDQYYQAEADFTYRFLKPVHAFRVGFGTLSGKGGPKDVIDGDMDDDCRDGSGAFHCRSVDYTYVYTEVELQLKPQVAVMLRPLAGLLTTDHMVLTGSPGRCRDAEDLSNCEFLTRLGFKARVRFGEERGTNLQLAAAVTQTVGTLFEAAYHWAPRPQVPVKLAVQVTDLPVTTDFGVRLVTDVGWRGVTWVYPSVRLSYQARDIDHAGFSGGLGLNFDW